MRSVAILFGACLLLVSAGPRTASSQSEAVVRLGVIDFGLSTSLDPAQHPKVVFVRGHRMTGAVDVTFRDEALWLDGAPWLPASAGAPDTVMPHPLDARMAKSDSIFAERIPFVRSTVLQGRTPREAVRIFWNQFNAMADTASAIYLRERFTHGDSTAALRAAGSIDTSMAVADLSSPRRPKFFPNGHVKLTIQGIFIACDLGTHLRTAGVPEPQPRPITLQEAQSRVEDLRRLLASEETQLAIYSRAGDFFESGDGAVTSLQDISWALSTGSTEITDRASHIPSELLDEIVHAAGEEK